MILNILNYKNPTLRKKSEEVKEITPKIKRLASDMQETMIKNKGLGLAAPQVGELKQMIVVHLVKNRSFDERAGLEPEILINPRIVGKSKEAETEEEGCLSAPGIFLKIKRAKGVKVEAKNIEGKVMKIEAEGLPARILQHEIDHLNGVLFFNRISFWQRLKIRKKLAVLEKSDGFN
ncbi:MAG: peptide deformylase [Parcubacteria group bacterium]